MGDVHSFTRPVYSFTRLGVRLQGECEAFPAGTLCVDLLGEDTHFLPAGRYPDDRTTCECGGWIWEPYVEAEA